MMTSIESLHDAIGMLAYAVAFADGKVQLQERKKWEAIVAAELRMKDVHFDIADISFKLMARDKMDVKSVYDWAMKEIRLNSHYLSPELKETFIKIMEKMARAYPPVTVEEQSLIDRFREDIEAVHGDPVFYEDVC
jgi:uncharacterized tellurite resistance protein B-like protein